MRAHLIALTVLLLGGCDPSCERTCRKLLSCEEALDTEGLVLEQCTDECTRVDELYTFWEDEAKIEAFDDHRACVVGATCEELAAGECYDALIFPYGER